MRYTEVREQVASSPPLLAVLAAVAAMSPHAPSMWTETVRWPWLSAEWEGGMPFSADCYVHASVRVLPTETLFSPHGFLPLSEALKTSARWMILFHNNRLAICLDLCEEGWKTDTDALLPEWLELVKAKSDQVLAMIPAWGGKTYHWPPLSDKVGLRKAILETVEDMKRCKMFI